jgi:hypothetical protein
MRLIRSFGIATLLGLSVWCKPGTSVTPISQSCPRIEESGLSAEWDPRGMAGEYRVQWVSDTGAQSHTSKLRLFLWKTSMLDSSPHTHTHPAPGDTDLHPLYGVIVPDEGLFTRSRVERLRAGTDPMSPPVLLLARRSRSPKVPPRDWTVLLIGTVGNRRDDAMILDGAGLGMWVRQVGPDGFKGFFEPWGIVVDDKGHYCARRVPN